MAIDTNDVRRRLGLIRDGMLARFHERTDTVDVVLVSAIAQEHVVLLGPPGTGKSAVLSAFTRCVTGARLFDTLLTRYSSEDEVCGPAKLSALKLDRFERNTDGYLPGVEIGFVDETFKANAAVLNSLLSVLNERKYKGNPCPLRFCAGASNEMPEDESLGALWDRFLCRHVVDYIKSRPTRRKFYREAVGRLQASASAVVPPATMTLDEWDAATLAARSLDVPDDVLEEVDNIVDKLAGDGIVVSDRRQERLFAALQADAWLNGDVAVTKDSLWALRFGLWSKPDERERVIAVLKTVDMGPARECQDIIDAALREYEARPTEPTAYYDAAPKLAEKLTAAAKRVQTYNGKLSTRAAQKVARQMQGLRDAHASLKQDIAARFGL